MPTRQRGQQTPNTNTPNTTPLTGSMLIGRPTTASTSAPRAFFGRARNFEPAVADRLDLVPFHGIYVPLNSSRNVSEILIHDSRWKNRIRFNQFTCEPEICPPKDFSSTDNERLRLTGQEFWRELTNDDFNLFVRWLDAHYYMKTDSNTVIPSLQNVSMDRTYHPVMNFLNQCYEAWVQAGKPQVASHLIHRYLGGDDTPLNRAFSELWLANAIARIRDPGCHVHESIVLVGKQGIGKSKAIRLLATGRTDSRNNLSDPRNWFADSQIDLNTKDKYLQIRGKWIYEIAEMAGFSGADSGSLKSFISSPSDNVRDVFTKKAVNRPRSVVFFGTTNDHEFLSDPNGEERRWWPVKLNREADLEALARDYKLIWGHAFDIYHHMGEDRTLPKSLWPVAAENTKDHRKIDPWEGPIQKFLESKLRHRVYETNMEEMLKIVGLHVSRQGVHDSRRMASIARVLGWDQARKAKERIWAPTDETRRKFMASQVVKQPSSPAPAAVNLPIPINNSGAATSPTLAAELKASRPVNPPEDSTSDTSTEDFDFVVDLRNVEKPEED